MATFFAESRIGLSTLAETPDILILGFQASSFCKGISSSSEASEIINAFVTKIMEKSLIFWTRPD